MDAVTNAKGIDDAVKQLIAAGCIADEQDENVFTFQSAERWSVVCQKLQSVWGWSYWTGPNLITLTPMRDGRVNYVFSINRR